MTTRELTPDELRDAAQRARESVDSWAAFLLDDAADELERLRSHNEALVSELVDAVADAERLRAQVAPAGLERCEFDDECDCCATPEGGSFTRLIHNPEDVTEAEFYICGSCVHKALSRYVASPAAPAQQAPDNNSLGRDGCFPAAEKTTAQQAEPTMKCSRCGVDRLKQPCGDQRPKCPMTGEAQQEPAHD
jgi:hypothetical protein